MCMRVRNCNVRPKIYVEHFKLLQYSFPLLTFECNQTRKIEFIWQIPYFVLINGIYVMYYREVYITALYITQTLYYIYLITGIL